MQDLYGEGFIEFVKSFYPTARPSSGRRDIKMRCRFCGDSKDPSHMHLYVKVPQRIGDIPVYKCFKCNTTGIADEEFFIGYGCNNPEMLSSLKEQLDISRNSTRYASLAIKRGAPLKNKIILDQNSQAKLDYINGRIGSQFTLDDLSNMKIIFSLSDILSQNNLQSNVSLSDIQYFTEHFIGFITYDNMRVILRRYTSGVLDNWMKDSRYLNYTLVQSDDATRSLYVIPTNINYQDPTPVQIHIAEGVFDILSVYYNLCGCNKTQHLYIAACGKGYKAALKFVLMVLGIINYEIHYYIDNDVSDTEFAKLIKHMDLLPTRSYYHRNAFPGEKDYGVPSSRIQDSFTVKEEPI